MRVKEYLLANPQVLEDFIMADISQEQLERWLIRKTQSTEHIKGEGSIGMTILLHGLILIHTRYTCEVKSGLTG